jgi:threonine dehydrogenase-like Zn-dependent dehydrogenase
MACLDKRQQLTGLSYLMLKGTLSAISIFTIELTIRGGHCSPYTYPKAISMVEKKQLPLEDIITHRLPLKDVKKGLKLVNSSKESIKVVLLPSQDVES